MHPCGYGPCENTEKKNRIKARKQRLMIKENKAVKRDRIEARTFTKDCPFPQPPCVPRRPHPCHFPLFPFRYSFPSTRKSNKRKDTYVRNQITSVCAPSVSLSRKHPSPLAFPRRRGLAQERKETKRKEEKEMRERRNQTKATPRFRFARIILA
jgi:hypothetical protein